jgi:hypothetical protein
MSQAPSLISLDEYPSPNNPDRAEFSREAYQYTIKLAQFSTDANALSAWINENINGQPAVTISTATADILSDYSGGYIRATYSGAKTFTIQPEVSIPQNTGAVFFIANKAAGDLTIVAGGGVTINNNVAIAQNGAAIIQRISADAYDFLPIGGEFLTDLSDLEDAVAALETEKAPLSSPEFTDNPKGPTPAAGDNSASLATTAFVRRDAITTVASIADLVDVASPSEAQQLSVAGWWSGSNRGGGIFIWRPSFSKSLHNGGSVISPTVPFVTSQAGADTSEKLAAYIAGTGETSPGGTGCFVRQTKRRYRLEDFGHQTGQDASVALAGVVLSGNKLVGLFAGDYLFSETAFSSDYASLDIEGCGDGVAYTAITRLLPFESGQSHLFSPASGCNAVKFSKLHFNGLDDCDFGVYQTQGAGWAFEDVSGNDFLDTCLYAEQGLNRYNRCFIRGGEGRAVVAYSDFAMDMCEFAGGTVPFTITAGGGRIGKIWLNSGTEACLDIYPRTSGTTHINTSIESLYIGESLGGASSVPIIRITGEAAQKVRQIQMSNLHIVCAQGTPDHINTMIVAEYADDVTIGNVAALGFGDFGTATKYTDGFLQLTDCLDWTIAGGVVADISKHPVRLTRSNVCFGDTLVFKDWGDALATGDEKVCIFSDTDSRVRIGDTQFTSNRIADGIPGKCASANRWRIGKVGLNVSGGGTFTFTDNLGSWESHSGSDPATFILGTHVTRYGQFSSLAGGGVTAMFTLASVAVDQSYHITVQQVGNPANGTSGVLMANAGSAGVITTGNTNAGATLINTFSLSGLGVRLNVGTGYGATTWQYQITRML